MEITKRLVGRIDRVLEDIKTDYYYKIIEFRYFENRAVEEIADYMNCDNTTIYRNKNRLS